MLEDIYHFVPLNTRLLTSGMPTADQLADAASAGVELVINLAPFDADRDLPDEEALVRSLGMGYLNIPVDWERPTHADLVEFMTAMEENQQKKLLVHCRANYRVSAFIALDRINRLGWQPTNAFEELRRIWDPEEYPVWKTFLEENLPGTDEDSSTEPA